MPYPHAKFHPGFVFVAIRVGLCNSDLASPAAVSWLGRGSVVRRRLPAQPAMSR